MKQLEDMLRYYTELMYVEVAEGARNGLELCCARDTLMHKVKDDPRFPNLVFTSFERGLKHAGLYVTQSTHGKVKLLTLFCARPDLSCRCQSSAGVSRCVCFTRPFLHG